MWILKNSNELLEHLKPTAINHVTSIKSFDFSTLFTTIPYQKLKNTDSQVSEAPSFSTTIAIHLVLVHEEAKSRKYKGLFEVKSGVKTRQVRGMWSQQLEH